RSFLPALLLFATIPVAGRPVSSLELEDCRISAGSGAPGIAARCGTLVRPLDPDNPDMASIALKVAVVAALSLEPASDPFVPIAGGPGQSTIHFYAGWSAAFERVRLQRDVVLLDQRGTGESAPLLCDVGQDLVEGKYSAAQTTELTKQCLALLPHDPRYFTTSVATRDLEALRLALGYDALNVYGISYGSRVAQHYARRFPDTTRTVILDGVVPPQLPLGPDIATESQRAIDSVFTRCAETPACNERFPELRDDFALLLGALAEKPVTISLQHPVTARRELVEFSSDHFAAAIRLLLYNPGMVALLPLLISDAADGNFAPLAAQFHMVAESLTDSLSIGMHNAVLCTEDAPFIDWSSVDQGAINASYMGPMQLEAIRVICAVWPRGLLDADLREPLATDKPVLLLSGDADPITPPYFAALAAVAMQQQWQVTGEQQGHGLAGVGCMPRIIAEFVGAASLAEVSTECLRDAFVMPFFVDYTGPMP
ncbi:MAG: alpha/beta hydrolase, partial [Gammaproteobacteria bacterium]|nr:alpha/beta hydrolase [Gammaproteobacteria bacterium]